MADPAIAIGVSDPFGLVALSANFKPQTQSKVTNNSFAVALNSVGDLGTESAAFDVRDDYSSEAKYSGSDLIGDLGAIATALWVHPVAGTEVAVESLTLGFTAADYMTLSITGHQHGTVLHADAVGEKWDWSGILATGTISGFGIPAMTATTHAFTHGSVSTTLDLSLTIAMTHIDVLDGAGVHFVGNNNGCRVDCSASGVGAFSDVTIGSSWKTDSSTDSDSNTEHDTWAFNGHLFLART